MNERKLNGVKPFEELTITDDFMFGIVMSDPKCLKPLLEFILGVKIAQIEYPERQKTIDVDYDRKGVRLDVYCEDDKKTVYAIEIQTTDQKNLPKRIRYYRDMLDINVLDKGANYKELKKSFVIFICTFDYFKKDRYMYTFVNQCQEDGDLYLNDETTSIVLNVDGTIGDINEDLKDALRYMAGQAPSGSYAETLDEAVKKVKINEKWRRDYMSLALKFREHEEIGAYADKVSVVRKSKGRASEEFIIDILGVDEKLYAKISDMIENNPDMSDWEIAEAILYEE
ncbi:MAG: Rpn family recombination-promoting nuclease/putative transposase [Thermoguttaceae bacterium]|nr:Rpn family recombination-promoting nuclease/putative transposase [Thermoguttaceae bacterium]